MKTNKILTLTGIVGVLLLALACNKMNGSNTSGNAKLNVHLTDAPAAFDAVNVDIQSIELTTDANPAKLVTINRPGVYNLLNFRNSLDTLLASVDLPAGKLSQIRLVLGDKNSVVVDGVNHPLQTPSAQESGLKINVQQTLEANGSYDIWVDFDAAKSVVPKGNGNYNLKPVLRAFTAETNGKIKGAVLPLEAKSIVHAIIGVDTLAAIPDALTGAYVFSGLKEGTYKVHLMPALTTGYKDSTVNNVSVAFGKITDIGTVTLKK